MSITPAAVEVIRALSAVLPRFGPWYLFGAQAVIAFGVPRLSADVDVTLRLAPESRHAFIDDMKAAAFELRAGDAELVRLTSVLPFVHSPTGMPVDVVLAGSGLEDEFLQRARPIRLEDVQVPTIDPEDLVIAKILAGRPKDLDDARGLWRIHGARLDAVRIRRVLQLLEDALAQNDLVPVFEEIQRHV
ncbi:MAG: hypothetical protein GEU99_02410 [Luteitalea sp.]|nr:hypothetical protein [Luteitalea sp.]